MRGRGDAHFCRKLEAKGLKHRAAVFICLNLLLIAGRLDAKLHIFLDERLRGSRHEKVLYKFIPLTSAQEVDLVYVSDFMRVGNTTRAALKLAESDRGIYIGADRWPGYAELTKLIKSPEWFTTLGKISFLVENDAPEYAQMPRGLYPRSELWRKFAQLTGMDYAGNLNLHYLDARQNTLEKGRWQRAQCVAQTVAADLPRIKSPLEWGISSIRLNFKDTKQLAYLGEHVCIDAPGGRTIAELRIARTDIALEATDGRFSVWNEAQPLRVTLSSDRSITAPLHLKVLPQSLSEQVDFFFQGDRLECDKSARCRPAAAKFLLPQQKELVATHELAIRSSGNAYYRGALVLLAGSIEVARTEVRFTQHSWLAETLYALSHPSEYQGLFLLLFAAALALLVIIWLLIRQVGRLRQMKRERENLPQARQTSAALTIRPGASLYLTAMQNPFGCELVDFGGIVEVSLTETEFLVRHGNGAGGKWPAGQVKYRLPDGYEIQLRPLGEGNYLLEVFLLNGTDSSPTSVKSSQSLPTGLHGA